MVMQYEEMEIKLWEYIDGTISVEERDRIALLINTDKAWLEKYEELLSFRGNMQSSLELMELPAGFSEKVMAEIEEGAIRYQARKRIFNYGIRAVCIFFIAIVILASVYIVQDISWSSGLGNFTTGKKFRLPDFTFPAFQLPGYTGNIAAFITVLAALLVFDKLFRRKATFR